MTLSLLLVLSMPVQAGPITISEVVQVLSSDQNTSRVHELHLRQRASSTAIDDASKSSTGGAQSATDRPSAAGIPDSSTVGVAPNSSDSLLAGVSLKADDQQGNINVAQGDLQGSICDCGEIPPTEAPGPRLWPLLFLAVIPLFFIHHHHDCDSCPTSTPTPPTSSVPSAATLGPCPACNTAVPEPASLLLFGSGLAALGAGLRRRHARGKLEKRIATLTEGQ
jgi:hypothetical protein